jgi:N-acetylated-alpha-linked acidic dipeptidase
MQKKIDKIALDPIVEDVSLDVAWPLVEKFSKMPRWKAKDVNKGADVIIKMLKDCGVPVEVHEPSLYLSIPYTASVEVGGKTMRAKPPAYSRDCRDGLTGALVHVPASYSKSITTLFGKNQDEDLSSAERIRGKIVISEGFAFPGKMLEFEQKGAIGIIAVNPGIDQHWGICTSIWGTPDLDDLPRKPGIPIVAVNNPDGLALIEMAAKSQKVTIKTEMEEGWFTQKVPVVTIPGKEDPDKFVLVHGHYDSWDVGVGDNATGDATLLELARVFWKNKKRLKRSVRIAWWPGHSTGRYAGSTWFADHFAIDLDENCVAQVNCDSPGCRWATTFNNLSLMAETEGFVDASIKAVTGIVAQGERPPRAGDYAFNNIGISSFFMLSSTMPDEVRAKKGYYAVGGCGGNIAWHTENDTIEIADREYLLRDMKVYAQAVIGVANADILPFDWTAVTREFSNTITKYQKAAGTAFDLGPAAIAVEDLDKALAKFNRAAKAGKIDPEAANAVILRLARILVPINYTREARFRHDPALPIPELPTLSAAAEIKSMPKTMQGFAKTQLTRGQNRFVAALREATRLVQSVG